MRLILVRHGQTQSNVDRLLDTGHPGAPLTDRGLEQAAALVETLAGEEVDAVFSSDLTRAVQTASPLAEALGVELVRLPAFREIFAGDHDMATDWQPYLDMFSRWFHDPAHKLPGGESWEEFLTRWDEGLSQVAATGVQCAVVVSHAAALKVWVPYAARNLEVGSAAQWPLHNTDLIVLEGEPSDGWTVRAWTGVQLGTD